MTWMDWVITPLVGAVIGYFTNWLAIKMLFRPHEEKRIFGIKLPFTPGLIPKERQKLSKAMGDTLSRNVLTQDVLMNSIASPEVKAQLAVAIDEGLASLEGLDEPLDSMAARVTGRDADLLLDSVEGYAVQAVGKLLANPALQAECERLVAEKLAQFLQAPKASLPVESIYNAIKAYASEAGLTYIQGEAFPSALRGFAANTMAEMSADGKTWGEVLPGHVVAEAKALLERKAPDIVAFLAALPERYPGFDNALREMVSQIAEQNFGRFIGIFVHYDSIYDNIKEKLFAYIAEPENQAALQARLGLWADELLAKDVAALFAHIPENAREALIDKLSAKAQAAIGETQIHQVFAFLEDKAGGLASFDAYACIKKLFPAFEETAGAFVFGLLKDELQQLAPKIIQAMRGKFTGLTPAQMLACVSAENKVKWKARLLDVLFLTIEKGGLHVVNALNVTKMVEDKLNSFSVAEAEEMVMSVVKRELSAITNLGALLGLIIGFVPLVLDLIR